LIWNVVKRSAATGTCRDRRPKIAHIFWSLSGAEINEGETMKRFVLASAVTLLAMAGIIGGALADPAVTRSVTNMRQGPDPRAPLVQRIPANAEIDVSDCTAGWCYASWRDVFGYVLTANTLPLVAPPPPVVLGPAYGFGFGYGFGPRYYGPGYYGPGWGPGWRHRW
jgi:hypothetical protein